MLKFGSGKGLKPRKFDYVPRYYDELKDNLEQRISKYDEDGDEETNIKERIRSGLKQRYNGDQNYRSKEVKRSNLRLLYIIGILILISILILRSDRITNFINSMG